MKISIDEVSFTERLGSRINHLSSLSNSDIGLTHTGSSTRKIVTAYNRDGRSHPGHTATRPEDFLQPTKLDEIYYRYYERWSYDYSAQLYNLERAYCFLSLDDDKESIQLYGIHIDRDEPPNQMWFDQKVVPHLHVYTSVEPIAHFHYPLDTLEKSVSLACVDEKFKISIDAVMKELSNQYSKDRSWTKDFRTRFTALARYREFTNFLLSHPS